VQVSLQAGSNIPLTISSVEERQSSRGTHSAHLVSVVALDLVDATPPVVRVEEVHEVAVVLSRSRDPRREVHLDNCRQDGVPVIVRPSGGGAVVLAPGMLAASVLARPLHDERYPEPVFRRYCGAVSSAFKEAGISGVMVRGVSDLCLADRKVAGSALRLWHEQLLFQVSVLIDANVDLLERYLALPSRMPDYRAGRSHRSFVMNLREAGFETSIPRLATALHRSLLSETLATAN